MSPPLCNEAVTCKLAWGGECVVWWEALPDCQYSATSLSSAINFMKMSAVFLQCTCSWSFLDFPSTAKHWHKKKKIGQTSVIFKVETHIRRLRASSKSGCLSEENEFFRWDFERSHGIYSLNSYEWMRVKPVCGAQGVKSHMRVQYDIMFYFPSSQKYLRSRGRCFRIFWEFSLKAVIPSHEL